jgi:SAM-dependent methyltransferase
VSCAPAPDHYSYRHYADPGTAQTFDAMRFGGPIGALVAETQARVLLEFLGPLLDPATDRATPATAGSHDAEAPARRPTVLDVGTGTGRAALLLARHGARVTGVDASESMLAVARQRAAADGVDAAFRVGDAHALDYADRSFDAAVSLRVLMHAPDWRQCVAELCRVADRLVVVDFPSALSGALFEAAARRAAHAFGARTEPYRVFLPGTMAGAFARNGFRLRSTHRQFVLPIALHKAIGSIRTTRQIENRLERIGLLRLFGSPITIVAERCASS